MTSSKKKRMSMLDSLASATTPSPAPTTPMMSSNRALRSARDAVDSHQVWELDPAQVMDHRMADRLDPYDVMDLKDAIEANGQTVPILVRRHPSLPDSYMLVYGRRRLEAIRLSKSVTKVRALVASMDDDTAVRAQISENMARRDLSFIEKALMAQELIANGFGNQTQVAEVLTVSKSAVSMALAVLDSVGEDLVRAIGPAHGVGRPRWDALGRAITEHGLDRDHLIDIADRTRTDISTSVLIDGTAPSEDASVLAFEAVLAAAMKRAKSATPKPPAPSTKATPLLIEGRPVGKLKRTSKGITIDLTQSDFADWIETQAGDVIEELHTRWAQREED